MKKLLSILFFCATIFFVGCEKIAEKNIEKNCAKNETKMCISTGCSCVPKNFLENKNAEKNLENKKKFQKICTKNEKKNCAENCECAPFFAISDQKISGKIWKICEIAAENCRENFEKNVAVEQKNDKILKIKILKNAATNLEIARKNEKIFLIESGEPAKNGAFFAILELKFAENFRAENAEIWHEKKFLKTNEKIWPQNWPENLTKIKKIEIAEKEKISDEKKFRVAGFVAKIERCQLCPPKMECKICAEKNLIIADFPKILESFSEISQNEMVLFSPKIPPKNFSILQKYEFLVQKIGEKFVIKNWRKIEN